jgi:hypothetical protein
LRVGRLVLAATLSAAPTFVALDAARAGAGPETLEVHARARFDAPEIEGSVEIPSAIADARGAPKLRVLLFANRFRTLDGVNELARHELIAGRTFRPGGTEIEAVEQGGRTLRWTTDDVTGFPAGTVASIDLGRDAAPGGAVTIRFRTRLPNLFDTFGASDGLLVADGGWYPMPLEADRGCGGGSSTHVELAIPPGSQLVANGRLYRDTERAELTARAGEHVSIVLSREPLEAKAYRFDGHPVRLVSTPSREVTQRISAEPTPAEALVATLPAILADSSESEERTIVRLPLRWYPSTVASGMVLVSDRLFEVFPILRPLHQRELAYALYLEEELRAAAGREPPGDRSWVAEGFAWRRADALYRGRLREGREVKDWIRLLGVFAIVDRFETAPRIPLLRPFFPVAASDDPLRIRLDGLCEPRPPGRFVFDKLEAKLRPAPFERLLGEYRKGGGGMRSALKASGGDDLDSFVAAWLRPYVPVDYSLANVELDPAGSPGARFSIERSSSESRPDAVEVGVETAEREESTFVDLGGASTPVTITSASPVQAVTIDPQRKAVETRLDDNRVPPRYQLLLDSADVEVSSTEFGISTLLVGRRRYDYQKDLAVAGFYTSRGYGVDAGFQLHGGKPIDANLYRQNLFAYYSLEELDSSFVNNQAPQVRTRGRLGGFGLRFNSYDAFWFENPAGAHHLRLFFDGYDPALGGDFGFVQGGGSLAYTVAVRDDTVVAAEVLNGYSAATGKGPIPNQGLFSLGGFRSIRGIGAEDQLGEDIFLARAELRHMLPWRFDGDFQEVLIARRLQAKLFVDTGRVENSSRRLYDPSGFAVGVGGGLNLFYDFMGFFPTTFYLDVATRADKGGSVQVLFGVGQPF